MPGDQTTTSAAGYESMGEFVAGVYGDDVHYGFWDPGTSGPMADAQRRLTDVIAAHLAPAAGSELLDVGCGSGSTARRIAATTGARVTGISPNPWEIERAVQCSAGDSGTAFRVADVTGLPFPDDSFDGAVIVEVLVHVPDRRTAFAELHRVLRPGGRLVVAEPVRGATAPTPAQLAIWLGARMAPVLSREKYRSLLTGAGFDVDRTADHTDRIRPSFAELRQAAEACAARLAGRYPDGVVEQARDLLLDVQSVVESCHDYVVVEATAR